MTTDKDKTDKTEAAITAASEISARLAKLESSAKDMAEFAERSLAIHERHSKALVDADARLDRLEAQAAPSTGQKVGVAVAAVATVVLAAVGGGIAGATLVTRRNSKTSATGGSLPLGDHSTHSPAQGNGMTLMN